uniref:Uncharacterized protein n=1 Tax=Arundo donax TaxID=35708 RepID=A0A0A9BH64_ARUDO
MYIFKQANYPHYNDTFLAGEKHHISRD